MPREAKLDELLEFSASLRWDTVPSEVRDRALLSIADSVGVMAGGRDAGASVVARRYLRQFETAGRPLAGALTPASVAWFCGIAGHVLDFDDTHWPTILHGSNPIVAALLAWDQAVDGRRTSPEARTSEGQPLVGAAVSGAALAEAYLAGFECAARVALSMPKGHYDRGWHVTGTVGGIGAAVAVGHLCQATPAELRAAVSLAAAQAGGHRQHFGSMAKGLNAGNAARIGLVSALLAGEGFEPDAEGIEGRRGMWAVMSDVSDPDALDNALGTEWETLHNGLKPYPCGVVSHPAIEAAELVRERHLSRSGASGSDRSGPDTTADIAAIELVVHPLVTELTNKDVSADFDVKFSVKTLVALGLLGLAGDPANFEASATAGSDAVTRLARLVTVVDDRGSGQDEAEMVVTLSDGGRVIEKVAGALGSPSRPVPVERAGRKFASLAAGIWSGEPRAAQVFEKLRTIDEQGDVGPLLAEIRDGVLGP